MLNRKCAAYEALHGEGDSESSYSSVMPKGVSKNDFSFCCFSKRFYCTFTARPLCKLASALHLPRALLSKSLPVTTTYSSLSAEKSNLSFRDV